MNAAGRSGRCGGKEAYRGVRYSTQTPPQGSSQEWDMLLVILRTPPDCAKPDEAVRWFLGQRVLQPFESMLNLLPFTLPCVVDFQWGFVWGRSAALRAGSRNPNGYSGTATEEGDVRGGGATHAEQGDGRVGRR
jgi:hypothetical protein